MIPEEIENQSNATIPPGLPELENQDGTTPIEGLRGTADYLKFMSLDIDLDQVRSHVLSEAEGIDGCRGDGNRSGLSGCM